MRIVFVFLLLAASLKAQTVAPPIVEYSSSKVTDDSFEIRNESETEPLIITGMGASTFSVDSNGIPRFLPINPLKISLKWSDNSMRIPPKQHRFIFVEMRCLDSKVCWACINIAISRGRNANGIAVTELLPHTIYLGLGSIKKKEAQVKFLDTNSISIVNSGPGLDRPLIELWTAAGKKEIGAPIFPNGNRIITSDSPISKVQVKFSKFKLNQIRETR